MKCIKEKCDYYNSHTYNESWANCSASSRNLRRDGEPECYIADEIRVAQAHIESLEGMFVVIKENNLNKLDEELKESKNK